VASPTALESEQLRELEGLYQQWLPLTERLFSLRDNQLKNQPALKLLHERGEVPISMILREITQMLELQEQRALSIEDAVLLRKLVKFKTSFTLQVAALRGYLTTRNASFRFDYAVNTRANATAWQALTQSKPLLTAEQQASLTKIEQARNKFLPLPDKMFAVVKGDRYREDLYLFQTKSQPVADNMLALLNQIVANEQQSLMIDLKQGNDSLTLALIQTVVMVLLAMAMAILLALTLRRQIADPIKRLTQVTTQIADGDLDARAIVESRDEIGTLAKTFNQMTQSLKQSQETLQDYSRTLECRVEERTQELQVKNAQLGQTLMDLKKAQTQLIQTEKMSGLGQLVAGIAHEINNPVNFIHGNTLHANQCTQDLLDLLELYEKYYPHPVAEIANKAEAIDLAFMREDLPKIMTSMQVGTDRIRAIVLSLRVFSRLDEAEVKDVNIHEGIDSTLMILQNRLKAKPSHPEIQIIKQYGNLPKIECYAGQLNQVFMNILTNAIDALEERMGNEEWGMGHEVASQCSTLNAQCSIPTIWIRTEVKQNQVAIAFADNGPGMPETVRQRLFDPFFTTKAVGKGTGLGLSISHQIVTEKHNGSLTCHSTPGAGTEFLIEIPIRQNCPT
jgi:signal transduction histidine kinase